MTTSNPPRADLTGQVFGALTVLSWAGFTTVGTQGKRRGTWNCRCACGRTLVVIHGDLTGGNNKRCGYGCPVVPSAQKGRKRINTGKPPARSHEAQKAAMRAAYRKNQPARRQYSRDFRNKDLPAARARLKAWRRANPDYKRHKWATDLLFRLKEVLRGRLYKAVKGLVKQGSAAELVGCTMGELREHLEQQFTEGMSWDNYGEWHIDHRKPIVLFDLSDETQQRACFHYSNLQPLWAADNLAKGGSYE